jgi:hypothetical protein
MYERKKERRRTRRKKRRRKRIDFMSRILVSKEYKRDE